MLGKVAGKCLQLLYRGLGMLRDGDIPCPLNEDRDQVLIPEQYHMHQKISGIRCGVLLSTVRDVQPHPGVPFPRFLFRNRLGIDLLESRTYLCLIAPLADRTSAERVSDAILMGAPHGYRLIVA